MERGIREIEERDTDIEKGIDIERDGEFSNTFGCISHIFRLDC